MILSRSIGQESGTKPAKRIECAPGAEAIRVVPIPRQPADSSMTERLCSFDRATERQRLRQQGKKPRSDGTARGWTRAELYRDDGAH